MRKKEGVCLRCGSEYTRLYVGERLCSWCCVEFVWFMSEDKVRQFCWQNEDEEYEEEPHMTLDRENCANLTTERDGFSE